MGKPIKFTPDADADIEAIADFTFKRWGADKELFYLEKIYGAIDDISDSPEIGKKRDDIKKGYHAYDIEEYLIFYRILASHIDILGVTGSNRNFKDLYKNRKS